MFGLFRRRATPPAALMLSPKDPLTRHSLHEGTFICGATGSGKTSGPGDAIARAELSAGAGACVMVAKNDEYARWERLCRETGRLDDLVRVAPGCDIRCDLLNEELNHPAGTVETAAQYLDTLLEVSNRKSEGRGDEKYWELLSQQIFRQSIAAVWYGNGKASLSDLADLINSAPISEAQAADPAFQARSVCVQTLQKARARLDAVPYRRDVERCIEFWMDIWPGMNPKTRSIGVSMAVNVLDKFLSGPMHAMVSSGTNFSAKDIIEQRKIAVLDMPYLQWYDIGRFFQILFKTHVQRAVLRRNVSQFPNSVMLFQDEGQLFVTRLDVEVQAVARQFRMPNIFITQSLPVLYEALGGGQRAEQQAKALIGNLQTKFLCQQSDYDSCEYWSDLLGQEKEIMCGGGGGKEYDMISDWLGTATGSANFHEQYQHSFRPEWWGTLAKGGPENNYEVECVCYQGGKTFSNGRTWIRTRFKQRKVR